MKTKIFILTALIFSLILFTVSCIADDPADESNNVSRSESTPQEESVNESTPPEESKPAEESDTVDYEAKIKNELVSAIDNIVKETNTSGRIVYGGHTISYDFINDVYALDTELFRYGYKDGRIEIIANRSSRTVITGTQSDYEALTASYTEDVMKLKDRLLDICTKETLKVSTKRSDTKDKIYQFDGKCIWENAEGNEEEITVRGTVTVLEKGGCKFLLFLNGVQTNMEVYFDAKELKYIESDLYKTDIYSSIADLKNAMAEFNKFYNSFFVYDPSYFVNKIAEFKLNNINRAENVKSSLDVKQLLLKSDNDITMVYTDEWMPYSEFPLNEHTRLDGYHKNSYNFIKDGILTSRSQQYGYGYQGNDHYDDDVTNTTPFNGNYDIFGRFENVYSTISYFMEDDDFESVSNSEIELYLLKSADFIDIKYTDNANGTITVTTDCTDHYLVYLYSAFLSHDNEPSNGRIYRNSAVDNASFTYDVETGMLIAFNFSSSEIDDFDYEISLKVEDADETMIPEVSQVLAGNW